MKPIIRYRSQLLFRRSFKPDRIVRDRGSVTITIRPARRFGMKPKLEVVS